MRNIIKRFYRIFLSLFYGLYRFSKRYVIPSIQFIEAIKALLDGELPSNDFNHKKYFAELLNTSEAFISEIMCAFVNAVNTVIPDVIDGRKRHIEILLTFIKHIKALEKRQRGLILFKTASLMVMNLVPDKKPIKENEADLLVQLNYSINKHKRVF